MTSMNRTNVTRRWRGLVSCAALLAATVSGQAQSAPAEATIDEKTGVVRLSKFEVVTTQDKGYVANNSATGFKTNQELIKIPQSVTVVTRDLIDDIGATKSSDVMQYAGASQFYRGESFRLRGARVLNAYLDEAIENVPYSDNANIDSYEVIRGPAGVLYANAGLGGVILKSSKKPLPFDSRRVNFSFRDYGEYRAELDVTGPAGSIGDAEVGYRLVAAYQGGDHYLRNVKDDRVAIHPTFSVQLKNTTIRFALDYVDVDSIAGGQNFVTPDGKIYTGAGRSEGYYPKGIMENHKQQRERIAILTRLSDNWESKTSLSHLKFVRQGTNLLPFSLDLQANTFTLFARRNYQRQENWVLNQDFLGNYHIGPVANQSAAGFTITDEYNRAAFLNANGATTGTITAPLFGTAGRQAFPIANPNMDSVNVPSFASYGAPSAVGSWTNNRRQTYYYQHQAEVIQDRLILVGGLSYAMLQINDVPSVVARTTAGGTRIVNFEENLHRYGIVLNVTKEIALYALDSTTFSPQNNSNTRDINGVLLPAMVGEGTEFGIKTALMGGKFSATLSFFDMSLTNVAVLQGGLSPVTGQPFFTAAGSQTQKGWDATLSYAPTPNWQIIATAYDGEVNDQNGAKLNNTYDTLYSFFSRYEFGEGSLKGFSIGGGGSKTGGNYFVTPGSYVFPVGVTPGPITLESVWNANIFASYKYGKNWTFRLNIENVLDKTFALGAQTPLFVDMSPPRTFQFSTSYKF
jgi:iron complex outermembrane recepter protein